MAHVTYGTALSLNCDLWGKSSGSYEVKTSWTPTMNQALWATPWLKHVSYRQEANTESRLWKTRLPYMNNHVSLKEPGLLKGWSCWILVLTLLVTVLLGGHEGPFSVSCCFSFSGLMKHPRVHRTSAGCSCPIGLEWSSMEAPPNVCGKKWRKAGIASKAYTCEVRTEQDCGFKGGREVVIMKAGNISEKSWELPFARYIGSSACEVCPAVLYDPNIPVLCFPFLNLAIRC